MRSRRPVVTLRAAITLDGRLTDPAPQLLEDNSSRTVDADGARALLLAGTVREVHLTICPRIDGRRDAPTLSGVPTAEFFPASLACRLLRMETRDGECLVRYRVLRPTRTARK